MASSAGHHARRGWLKMSARFLVRSLTLRRSSFFLAFLAVTVGATVSATLLNLKADLRAKMSRELRRFGPNLLVTPRTDTGSPTLDEKPIRELPALLAKRGVSTGSVVSPLLIVAATIRALREATEGSTSPPGDLGVAATVAGVDFETLPRINPTWRTDGAWPRRGDLACLVGASLARRAGLAAGSMASVTLASSVLVLPVSGILMTGESEDDEVLVPLDWLQAKTGLAGSVTLAALSVDGGPSVVRRAGVIIEKSVPGSSARPLWQVAAAQGSLLRKIDRMMLFLTLIVLLLCGLCVMTTLLSIVIEREREIGLMRSMGAGDAKILEMFLGEVSLLGLVGGATGLVLGSAAARLVGVRLFAAAIEPRLAVLPWVLAVSLGLCWIAVLVPLRRALAIQPAAALRGD